LFLPWDKILELEDAVKNTNINPVENLAIYYLYTQLPPRRLEYGSLIIQIEGEFENNKKKNYVVLDKKLKVVKKIILNTYKTSEKYGPYVIDNVPEKLSDAIVNLIKEQDYKAGDHLFMNSRGKPYGNSFSSRLKDVFDQAINRPITLNILRHSYITYFINNNTTTLKKKMIANQMGHSTNMQDLYKRFEEKDEEKEED
jgi:integrase